MPPSGLQKYPWSLGPLAALETLGQHLFQDVTGMVAFSTKLLSSEAEAATRTWSDLTQNLDSIKMPQMMRLVQKFTNGDLQQEQLSSEAEVTRPWSS